MPVPDASTWKGRGSRICVGVAGRDEAEQSDISDAEERERAQGRGGLEREMTELAEGLADDGAHSTQHHNEPINQVAL